jgi:hypothetical protein
VRLVEQVVTVERKVEVAIETLPRGAGWAPAVHQLAQDVDAGRVYDRDLPALIDACAALERALHRRSLPARR